MAAKEEEEDKEEKKSVIDDEETAAPSDVRPKSIHPMALRKRKCEKSKAMLVPARILPLPLNA